MAGYKAPLTSRVRRRRRARPGARSAAAPADSEQPLHPDLDYVVEVKGGHVVLAGTNDGNIRAAGGEAVRFRLEGSRSGGINIAVEKLAPNRAQRRGAATPEWPFATPEPRWPQTVFHGRLKRPGLLGATLYRYTVTVEGSRARPAVRFIVIDRR